VNDGQVYTISSGELLAALDFYSGEPKWETFSPAPVLFTPLLWQDQLIYATSNLSNIYFINPENGETIREWQTADWISAAMIQVHDLLLVPGKDGSVTAYPLGE
jgi:outer membrane protein assembly factor BamB